MVTTMITADGRYTRHNHPTNRSDSIDLVPRETNAYRLWRNQWHAREYAAGYVANPPTHRLDASLLAHDDVCAELAAFVEADLARTPMDSDSAPRAVAEYKAAKRIQRVHRELTGWSPVVLPMDTSTQCRHGVEYDDDCTTCDTDF